MEDETLKQSIENDPFHAGLTEHGEFKGFTGDKRQDSGGRSVQSMTDEEIEKSRSVLARLVRSPQMLLVLTYIGLIFLMGKVYA